MLIVFGEDGVKTIEDFAGYAVDDLCGWREKQKDEVKHYKGVLNDFSISRAEAEEMITQARLKAGWLENEDVVENEGLAD